MTNPIFADKPTEEPVISYPDLAKQLLVEHLRSKLDIVTPDEVYVVWFSKTLQNWKALLSTSRKDSLYYELTWNGDRAEGYLDTYRKTSNVTINTRPVRESSFGLLPNE